MDLSFQRKYSKSEGQPRDLMLGDEVGDARTTCTRDVEGDKAMHTVMDQERGHLAPFITSRIASVCEDESASTFDADIDIPIPKTHAEVAGARVAISTARKWRALVRYSDVSKHVPRVSGCPQSRTCRIRLWTDQVY